ncbi:MULTISPECIES: hypothetical protein [Pseudoalteromonas]|nr:MULTISPECIES: hypothetical protein [Pseudoalteromonas]
MMVPSPSNETICPHSVLNEFEKHFANSLIYNGHCGTLNGS